MCVNIRVCIFLSVYLCAHTHICIHTYISVVTPDAEGQATSRLLQEAKRLTGGRAGRSQRWDPEIERILLGLPVIVVRM